MTITVNIKDIKECRNGAYANFIVKSRNKADIVVSNKLNTSVAEYGASLLHELLHLWVFLLKLNGFKVGGRKEHKMIYAVEETVIKMAKRHLKGDLNGRTRH